VVSSVVQPLRRLMSVFTDFQVDHNSARPWFGLAVAGSLAVAVAGCNPMLDRQYMDEGAGATLYTTDQARQTALLDEYLNFLCLQARTSCADYVTLVQAGMNDIDQRCDGYLTWLDARRRDRAPVMAEIAAVQTAIHTVMTVTGSSPQSLDILTAAFGLATATYTNWNSRLLISIEQSTVQEVVYNSQRDYRDKTKSWPVPDQPTAIYLLRNYLRLCMPITIEANINTTTRLVQRGASPDVANSLVVRTTTTTPAMRARAPITRVTAPVPAPVVARPTDVTLTTRIGRYEQNMSSKDLKFVLNTLCVSGGDDLGPAGSDARRALTKFLTDNGKSASDKVTVDVWDDIRELKAAGKRNC